MARVVLFTVRFPKPHTHYAEVDALFPVRPHCEFFLPVWTPGSYLIREYSRNIEDVRINGNPAIKTRKNRWRSASEPNSELRLTYRIYCREMSVRTNWVEPSFALLNGAATFITLAGQQEFSYEISLEPACGWTASACGLNQIGEHRYFADDFDALVDSPIYAGSATAQEFEVCGISHFLVNHGDDGPNRLWDASRAIEDVRHIFRKQEEFWGGLPYSEKYVLLNLLVESSGGIEHRNSMCLMASRWAMRSRRTYLKWLALVSHEFFHSWNVTKLRPAEFVRFDYENENYTGSLWVAEGITEYYAHLLLARAGIYDWDEYLASDGLSGAIERLQTTPGRLSMALEQASFDSWIKLYRPDENSHNSSVSYYVKGAVVAWLLDVRIRRSSGDRKSLDDLMRLCYSKYSGQRGFTSAEFQTLASELAEAPLDDFFSLSVQSPGELDYSDALDWFGLRFRADAETGKPWIGAHTKIDSGRLIVTRIPRGTPAFDSGLSVDDEIIAIDGFRVRADQFGRHLEHYRPGEPVVFLVARREKLIELSVTPAAEPHNSWRLEMDPAATCEQQTRLYRWLK
ncbi:MAG TPA: PDZ domain-containing protein [Bryobacteraceae bacterium]|nr:PDZ domain-containing protein [Bryobacteraceae bacterium]